MTFKINEYFAHALTPANQRLWQALAFHAGYLNAAGFMACHRFVSHMTGFGAQVGINVGHQEYLFALEMLFAPIFFIVGAAYAGSLVDRKLVKNMNARVKRGLFVIFLLDLIVYLGGVGGMFGEFGEPLIFQRDFLLLFILCFCCGLQNGLFVSLTGGQVRTTHITGLCTDIGLNIVKYFSLKDEMLKASESKRNWLRLKTIVAFSTGSLISAIIFQHLGYSGFLGSTAVAGGILLYVVWVLRRESSVLKDPGVVAR